MAWWHTRLLFFGDELIGVDLDRLVPADLDGTGQTNGGLQVTAVQVSGYALYGELRGYYALGVAELAVDPHTGVTTPVDPDADLDPRQHLTPRQKKIVRNWLKNQSPTAWDTSLQSFKRALE